MVQDSKATTCGGAAGCKMEAQCKGGVRADGVSSLIVAASERRGLLGVGLENMKRSWVIEWGAQQGLGVVASRWLGGGKVRVQGIGMGWGAIVCHLRHVLFKICSCISAFRLDEKGCWRTSILCTHIHEYISHLFYLFILLSYLIFDFICLTLSLADTHGIAKYARTCIQRCTHTRTHENKKEGEKKRRFNDNQQITVIHFGENRRLHLESAKQNYYIISFWAIIKANFFLCLYLCLRLCLCLCVGVCHMPRALLDDFSACKSSVQLTVLCF